MRTSFKIKHYWKHKSQGVIYLHQFALAYVAHMKAVIPLHSVDLPQWCEHPDIRRITRRIKVNKKFLMTPKIRISEYK